MAIFKLNFEVLKVRMKVKSFLIFLVYNTQSASSQSEHESVHVGSWQLLINVPCPRDSC